MIIYSIARFRTSTLNILFVFVIYRFHDITPAHSCLGFIACRHTHKLLREFTTQWMSLFFRLLSTRCFFDGLSTVGITVLHMSADSNILLYVLTIFPALSFHHFWLRLHTFGAQNKMVQLQLHYISSHYVPSIDELEYSPR